MTQLMTPKERIRAAFDRSESDRVPAYPMSCTNNATMMGMPVVEYSTDGEKMAQAYIEYYKRFKPHLKPDVLILFQDTFVEAEALGTKIKLRDDAEPVWSEPAIDSPKDIEKLKIPDPARDARMPVMLECASIVQREIGKEVKIGAVCLGPFSICGALRGEERFMIDLVENPPLVHRLMEISTEALYRYGLALKKAGASASVSEPLPTIVSLEYYDKYDYPYLKDLVARWEKAGVHCFLHVCGQSDHILEGLARTGCWAISVDENMDIGEAKRRVGDKVVVVGNVDPIDTMQYGTPERIEAEVRDCIRKAASGSGYILSTGCECPIGTPFENLEAFMEAAWKYGTYPLDGR